MTLDAEELSSKIRLERWQIEAIQNTFKEVFGDYSHLWIFGSRTDLSQKGGDIDLYIEPELTDLDELVDKRAKFYSLLMMRLGEQKVDIVLYQPLGDILVYKMAKENGVQLV